MAKSEWEMLHDKMKCRYFRQQVKKEFDIMLSEGRIDKKTYDACVARL